MRSRLRAASIDSTDSFAFANVTVDGYSGAELNEGYQTGIVLKWGPTGDTKLTLFSADGGIQQDGSGLVTFNGNVHANNDVQILGNLTVLGTTTEIDSETLVVADPIVTLNASGTELLSDWAGLTMREADGYNRIGWSFDGYWAVSVAASGISQSDANPDRALAFLGTGIINGDLSSTGSGNSGADHIGNTAVGNLASINVQDALEELQGDVDNILAGNWDLKGTTSLTFMINRDATTADEDACLILKGGDGAATVDGYLCMITDSSLGDRMQFSVYQSGSVISPDVHIGQLGVTTDLDATLTLNAGSGGSAVKGVIKMFGTEDSLHFTADHHTFNGPVRLTGNEQVDGYLYVNGNTVLGNLSSDTLDINATIVSDLVPTNNTYYVGTPTNRWIDGYFDFFVPTNYTPVGSNYSLEGHLKGIDAKLDTITNFVHGTYVVTIPEGIANTVDSARAVDQGALADVSSYTDAQFRDNVYIYLDGQLLLNDTAKRVNNGAVVNDVARDTGTISLLRFSRDLKRGSILQIVITG